MDTPQHRNTLNKSERMHLNRHIGDLFAGGGRSLSSFPLRVVYKKVPAMSGEPQAAILISVPKRRLKHAVSRNLVKRQIRESYRQHKHTLLLRLGQTPDVRLHIAFLWLADRLYPTATVQQVVCRLLQRIVEQMPESTQG